MKKIMKTLLVMLNLVSVSISFGQTNNAFLFKSGKDSEENKQVIQLLEENYSGFNISSEDLDDFQTEVDQLINLEHSTGYFATYSLMDNFQSDRQEIYEAISESIQSDKYIIFVLYSDNEEKTVDFDLILKNDDFTQEELNTIASLIKREVQEFFAFNGILETVISSITYGLHLYRVLFLSPDNQELTLEAFLGTNETEIGNELLKNHELVRPTTFVSLSGMPIRLPKGSIARFTPSTVSLPNGKANGLLYEFTIDDETYRPYYYTDNPTTFSGYKKIKNPSLIDPTMSPVLEKFDADNFQYNLSEEISVYIGYVVEQTECKSQKIVYTQVNFEIKWVSPNNDLIGPFRSNEEVAEECINGVNVWRLEEGISYTDLLYVIQSPELMQMTAFAFIQTIPCQVLELSLDDLYKTTPGVIDYYTYSGGEVITFDYKGHRLATYVDNDAEINYYLLDPIRGWQYVDIVEESLASSITSGILEALRYFAEEIVPPGVAFTVNLYVGNAYGVFAAFGVDILESAIWYVAGNEEQAATTLIWGAAGGAVGAGLKHLDPQFINSFRRGNPSKNAPDELKSTLRNKGVDNIDDLPTQKIITVVKGPDGSLKTVSLEDMFIFARKSKSNGGLGWTDDITNKFYDDIEEVPELFHWVAKDLENRAKAWKSVFDYPNIRKNPVELEYIDNHVSTTIKTFDDVAAEVPKLGTFTNWKLWNSIWKQTDDFIGAKTEQIKNLYSDAKVGYRGSMATGQKHNNGNPLPFDLDDFDVDAFIVSDELAALYPPNTVFRNARVKSTEIANISDDLEASFISSFPGYRIEPGKPFTFRVWTEAEYQTKVVPFGHKIID